MLREFVFNPLKPLVTPAVNLQTLHFDGLHAFTRRSYPCMQALKIANRELLSWNTGWEIHHPREAFYSVRVTIQTGLMNSCGRPIQAGTMMASTPSTQGRMTVPVTNTHPLHSRLILITRRERDRHRRGNGDRIGYHRCRAHRARLFAKIEPETSFKAKKHGFAKKTLGLKTIFYFFFYTR